MMLYLIYWQYYNMSEFTLNKEDEEIAQSLNDLVEGISGGDEINFEDLPDLMNDVESGEKKGGNEPINTNSVVKTLADSNDMRRLLSDMIE